MSNIEVSMESQDIAGMKVYTLAELKDVLGVSYRTMLTYVKSGRLKAVKIGGKWKVSESNLKAFVNGES